MLTNIVTSIENSFSEQMVIGRLNCYFLHIHSLTQMEHRHHLMVIQIAQDALDLLVLDVQSLFPTRRLIIQMFVDTQSMKMVNGNKDNVIYFLNLDTRVHRDKAIILEMRKWMGLSTSVSNAEIGLPDSC